MKRTFLSLALFLACVSAVQAECNPALRIGFIGSFSGESRTWGESLKNGFTLGLESQACSDMKITYEDDEGSSAKTVSAFHKLVSRDGVNVVIAGTSLAGQVLGPLAEQRKVALFVWASDAEVARNRPFVVRTWSSGEDEGKMIAELAEARGYRRIAAFSSTHNFTQSVSRGMHKKLKAEALVLEREMPLDATDFRTELLQARAKSPDAIYACLVLPGRTGLFALQARSLGLTMPIFGCEGMELEGNFSASKGALDKAWWVTGAVQADFEQVYRDKYKEVGTLPGAAIHYDLARILSATRAATPAELVSEVLAGVWEARGVGSITPSKEAGDQALKVKLIARHFTSDGRQLEGVSAGALERK